MKIFDISVNLNGSLPSWPGEAGFKKAQRTGSGVVVTELAMGAHSGTHIDAPYHFIEGGKRIGDFPPERFMGRARVSAIRGKSVISLAELREKELKGVKKILFKTANSGLWGSKDFSASFIGLERDAAEYLLELGIELIGADYLSIEAYGSEGNPIHKLLLGNEVLLLEGLNLAEVEEGDYELICLPLKLDDCEASPVRAVLIENAHQSGQ